MAKRQVWTKRCSGEACADRGDPNLAAFIPDDVSECDFCLLAKYGMVGGEVEVYGDPLGTVDAYKKETVVRALRAAELPPPHLPTLRR